jgi:fumarate reductase subunit D
MASRDRTEVPSWGDVLEWSDERMVPARRPRARPSGPQARAEAMAWAMFSTGGFVAAILIPVHVAILGIAYAAGWLPHDALSYGRIHHLAQNPLVKLYLWGLISLPLFHWAHRFRFAIHHQFGIHWRKLVALGCYGTAVAGTVLSAAILLRI